MKLLLSILSIVTVSALRISFNVATAKTSKFSSTAIHVGRREAMIAGVSAVAAGLVSAPTLAVASTDPSIIPAVRSEIGKLIKS